MIRRKLLRRDDRGAAAVELALALPILIAMIYGIFQVGLLYQANAGMQHALGEGARYASLCLNPTATGCSVPTDANIKARINSKLFGRGDGAFTVADPTTGSGFKTLTVSYTKTMNFIFIAGPTITLSRSKKVYTVT
jgi:Flp pilus assembly protein TadG